MITYYEVIYIDKRGREKCWGDFEGNEIGAIFYQQWMEYEKGYVCWIERI